MCADVFHSILIVDDDMTDLNALNNILKANYTVYFAKSGNAALKRAKENNPDIILLDIIMPDMNGFEVLSELKKNLDTRNIPVIIITGLNGVMDEEKGLRLGAVDYITKPFHSAIIKARIESHLNTARQFRENNEASFLLKTRQEMRRVRFRDLEYVDVSGHWLYFHLSNGEKLEVYSSLKEYESVLLSDPKFARCHKSFVINMDYVDVVEVRDVLMKNGDRLPISKGFANFKKKYIEWIDGSV